MKSLIGRHIENFNLIGKKKKKISFKLKGYIHLRIYLQATFSIEW